MIQGKKVLAVLTARGGSKGVPRKNIREVAGKPLIAWTIEAAKQSAYIDRVVLSSEDAEIIEVARQWGCDVPFVRPQELALDTTPGIDPILHACELLPEYDYVMLLQPTSPLRTVEDIDGCIELILNQGAPSCVSVTEPDKSPYWMYQLDEHNRMHALLPQEFAVRRQDLPTVYALNGALYIAEVKWLKQSRSFLTAQTIAFPMTKENSVDIDTEQDLLVAGFMLEGRVR